MWIFDKSALKCFAMSASWKHFSVVILSSGNLSWLFDPEQCKRLSRTAEANMFTGLQSGLQPDWLDFLIMNKAYVLAPSTYKM